MDVWEAIKEKRAVRQFKDEPLPGQVVRRILNAGRLSQSSKNSQPWDFIAIQDHDTLIALSKTGEWMGHVAGAALCVAIVTPAPEGNERYPWNMFDAGQSASYMQLAALELGVASCPGTVYDVNAACKLLNIPPGKSLRLVLSFGYPLEAQGERPRAIKKDGRRPFDEVIHWERW
jgi:nitroreductase